MKTTFTLLLCLFSHSIFSQYAMNLVTPKSPERSISERIGYTEVLIRYSSPSVRERDIWGSLVPYDEVWRAGANYATTLRFSAAVNISGKTVDAGTYTFFIIPKESGNWELILNATGEQWGAFSYDSKQDALRWEVSPEEDEFQEQLRYEISNSTPQQADISISWANVTLRFPLKAELASGLALRLDKNLETAENHSRWVFYLQAAEILLKENKNLDTALEWINKSEENAFVEMEWNPQFYPRGYITGHMLWTKAKILYALGKVEEAISYAEKMRDTENPIYYSHKMEAEQIDETIAAWKKE